MAKFHAVVGFVKDEQTSPGVYSKVATEQSYSCDVLRSIQRWENGEQLSDNLSLNNRFSILANEFVYTNINHIRYLIWEGTKWKITSIEIQRPRLILTIGSVYNG